jgi:tetratricopeptide (TPR) repeat protein
MAGKGQLRAGVNEKGCVTRVCQEDARQLYSNGEYERALASLDVLAEDLSGSPSYLMDRGNVYYALGRFEKALEDLDASLASPDAFTAPRSAATPGAPRFDDAHAQFEKP